MLLITAMIFAACNNEADKTSGAKTETKKKSSASKEDSYTNDTMYQELPGLLEDISGSTDMETVLAQNWINKDDKESLEYDAGGTVEMAVRSLSMAKDHAVTKNIRNYMETGKWEYNDAAKTITFRYDGGGKDVYKIRALAADELRLTNTGIGSETVLVYVSDAKVHKDAATDPFSIANNRWRNPPAASETDEAIKQRVKGYLHFFILYYRDMIARRSSIVSFYGFPSCLKWYAGGIYLQTDEDLLKGWNSIFYNHAQAKKGKDIVSGLLEKKYVWPSGKQNWIKKNLSVLEQMYKNL